MACVSTPSEHSPHWAEIICLCICLTPEPGCLWKAESQGLAHICTYVSGTWLHIHYTCTERIMSSHKRKCSKLLVSVFMTSRFPGRATKIKRSPHCLCTPWTAVIWIIAFNETSKFLTSSSQLCHVKHQEEKHSAYLSRFYLNTKLPYKMNVPWNTSREILF